MEQMELNMLEIIIGKGVSMNKIFRRQDYIPLMGSYDQEENDMIDYAIYTRVEDTVFRINYADLKTGHLSFDYITSTLIQPPQEAVDYVMQGVLYNIRNNKKGIRNDYKHY